MFFPLLLQRLRILHLEPSETDHWQMCGALGLDPSSTVIERVDTLDRFKQRLTDGLHDIVVSAYHCDGFTAMDAWEVLLGMPGRQPAFIVLSRSASEAEAIDAVRRGACDFVRKSTLSQLARVMLRALDASRIRTAKEDSQAELAGSVERSTELNEYLRKCIEEERQAIAREVHDDIGGSLAALKSDLGWICKQAKEPDVLAHANAATEMLEHAIGASQRIVQDLYPPVLERGIVAAVDWLAGSFEQRTGVKTAFTSTHEVIHAPEDVQLVAYRTAQAALTTIARHAACSEVRIDLSDGENMLTLEITDNGRRLTRAELPERPRALRGLGARARTVDGRLAIRNRGGAGTSIILSVPLVPVEGSLRTARLQQT
ncbi:hybrid sensor histidine kinase/response regulator [Variovorax rhizosphaerae]|uniref:histidine kinase n=1 Tax=Variovorax rhizosphaerae TaxID=1836200 RepID=A0ABU8WK21_9BURK